MIALAWALTLAFYMFVYSVTGLTWKYFFIALLSMSIAQVWKIIGKEEGK
jgi:hypothetical protein